jgi:antitoxin MazE
LRISKRGNGLAVRLPASVVRALGLKPGDDIDVNVRSDGVWEVSRKSSREETLKRLETFQGSLPADFKIDRDETNRR